MLFEEVTYTPKSVLRQLFNNDVTLKYSVFTTW